MTTATPGPAIRRPAYREGRLLDVAELQAEQQSRTGALTRHEGNVHAPGVAFGLQVTASAVPGITGVDIQPGLAVDGAGHYLVLGQPLTASLADGESVTISIVWRGGTSQIELSDVPPPAPADRTSDAWPVVLGQAAVSSGMVSVDPAAREELELRATALTAPAGGSRVILGGHGGRRAQVLGVQLADGHGGFGDVTTVDGDGTGRITVPASVADAVQVSGSVALATAVPAPSAASPWSLYRATVTLPDKTVAEQLRLEVGEVKTGVDPHALELLIAQGGAGQDLLHVDAGGTVTIPGSLTVEGVTTVSGWATSGPGGGTGATTLSGLAASEANVLAAAQALLNQLTNTDLKASAQAVSSAGGTVSYTLQLASSATMAVTDIAAYETVVVGGSVVSRQFVAQGVSLSPAGTADIPRTIPVGGTANVAVLAIGAGQDGQPRAATLNFSA